MLSAPAFVTSLDHTQTVLCSADRWGEEERGEGGRGGDYVEAPRTTQQIVFL